MELVSTMEISGEEREIADAYARGQIEGINSNLSQLELSDIAGGKNLFNPKCLLNATYDEKTHTITVLTNTNKALDMVFKENTQYTFSAYIKQSSTGTNIRFHIIYTDGTSDENFLLSQSTSEVYISATSKSGKTISEVKWTWGFGGTATFRNLQIEEGTTATAYEPYIPSVKMLSDEVNAQNDSLADIEFLGWSVPKECTIKNYVDSDGVFHQRVAREDLGYLDWKRIADGDNYYFRAAINGIIKRPSYSYENANILCNKYKTISQSKWHLVDDSICYFYTSSSDTVSMILVHDESYTDSAVFKNAMKGVYLYYELAEEKTIVVGSEAVAVLKNDLSDCCKKSDITTNETLIGTFNGKNYYRRLFTGIGASGSSVTVNVGEKIEIYNYYGRAYVYGQSGASAEKYPIPNKNYYIESQNISETSFQLTIPTSSDTRKVDLVIEYTKVDE